MLEILEIEAGSIAEELGLMPGDVLVAINRQPIRDLLDYELANRQEEMLVEVRRLDGVDWEIELEKDADDPLGVVLPHPEPMECGNNCIFCFVHQLPKGLRRSLYVKDEDYRFSYLYGAYVTLSNLDDEAFERILTQKLSPLYVSVHATDENLRQYLLGRQAPPILEQLQRLVDGGIRLHTQIVVCPDVNDGEALAKTVEDLVQLAEGIESLAIVPVGLTGHRLNLPELRPLSPEEAAELVRWIEARQKDCLQRFGRRFLYAADELYLKAGLSLPALESYEDFPQIENGVGLIAQFRARACEVLADAMPIDLPPIDLVTGESAADELKQFARQLSDKTGIELHVHIVKNRFFGGHVTVTGLLSGTDMFEQLHGQLHGHALLLPDVVLRDGDQVLLDDVSVEKLSNQLGITVVVIPSDPWGVLDGLDALALESG